MAKRKCKNCGDVAELDEDGYCDFCEGAADYFNDDDDPEFTDSELDEEFDNSPLESDGETEPL